MSQFTEQLKELLKKDIEDLNALSSLLEQEKAALKTRDSATIETLAKSKAGLVKTIKTSAKLKAKIIAESKLGIRPGKVEQTLETLNDPDLVDLWKSSRQKLSECKDDNKINGSVISSSIQRTNRLMNIIRGQHKAPNLYSQKGKEQTYSGTHQIGKA